MSLQQFTAAAPLVGGGLAAGGSVAGGKKGASAAKHAADQQYAIQQQQLQFGRDVFNTGMQAWQPANQYFQTLLKGDPNAVNQAVGPTSDVLASTSAATQNQIRNAMPQGGERNLALGQANLDRYNQMARLYAGVQPQAATALGQLAGLPVQAGTGIMGQGAPNVSAGLKYDRSVAQQAQQGAAGLGGILYNMTNKVRSGGGGGGGKGGGKGGSTPLAPTSIPTWVGATG